MGARGRKLLFLSLPDIYLKVSLGLCHSPSLTPKLTPNFAQSTLDSMYKRDQMNKQNKSVLYGETLKQDRL